MQVTAFIVIISIGTCVGCFISHGGNNALEPLVFLAITDEDTKHLSAHKFVFILGKLLEPSRFVTVFAMLTPVSIILILEPRFP